MDNDPILRMARERALLRHVADYLDLDLQLSKSTPTRPIATMLAKARDEAAMAMVALVIVDPSKVEEVRKLQNEVRRFDDLVRWTRKIIVDGRDAESEIESRSESIEDVIDYLRENEPEEAEALGMIERIENADA